MSVSIEAFEARYAPVSTNTPAVVKASGVNTMFIEPELAKASRTYSHTWLINIDAITYDYAEVVIGLIEAGCEWPALNGATLVIRHRVNHGMPDPVLPFRGQEVNISGPVAMYNKGVAMTGRATTKTGAVNPFAGLPKYDIASYTLVEPKKALSFAELRARRNAPAVEEYHDAVAPDAPDARVELNVAPAATEELNVAPAAPAATVTTPGVVTPEQAPF